MESIDNLIIGAYKLKMSVIDPDNDLNKVINSLAILEATHGGSHQIQPFLFTPNSEVVINLPLKA